MRGSTCGARCPSSAATSCTLGGLADATWTLARATAPGPAGGGWFVHNCAGGGSAGGRSPAGGWSAEAAGAATHGGGGGRTGGGVGRTGGVGGAVGPGGVGGAEGWLAQGSAGRRSADGWSAAEGWSGAGGSTASCCSPASQGWANAAQGESAAVRGGRYGPSPPIRVSGVGAAGSSSVMGRRRGSPRARYVLLLGRDTGTSPGGASIVGTVARPTTLGDGASGSAASGSG